MRLKYLYKRPKSATEVMNVIKEAYDAFHEQQDITKTVKLKYENELMEQGIYEGSIVTVSSNGSICGHKGKIISIRRDIVVFEDQTEEPFKKWKLQRFKFEKVKE